MLRDQKFQHECSRIIMKKQFLRRFPFTSSRHGMVIYLVCSFPHSCGFKNIHESVKLVYFKWEYFILEKNVQFVLFYLRYEKIDQASTKSMEPWLKFQQSITNKHERNLLSYDHNKTATWMKFTIIVWWTFLDARLFIHASYNLTISSKVC